MGIVSQLISLEMRYRKGGMARKHYRLPARFTWNRSRILTHEEKLWRAWIVTLHTVHYACGRAPNVLKDDVISFFKKIGMK